MRGARCVRLRCPALFFVPPRSTAPFRFWHRRASGCYGDDYAYFESAHGSAPDIAGRNIIDPTATLQSAIMMLEYLGFSADAERLTTAINAVCAEGRSLTPDQGGSASTTEFCDAVSRALTVSPATPAP